MKKILIGLFVLAGLVFGADEYICRIEGEKNMDIGYTKVYKKQKRFFVQINVDKNKKSELILRYKDGEEIRFEYDYERTSTEDGSIEFLNREAKIGINFQKDYNTVFLFFFDAGKAYWGGCAKKEELYQKK